MSVQHREREIEAGNAEKSAGSGPWRFLLSAKDIRSAYDGSPPTVPDLDSLFVQKYYGEFKLSIPYSVVRTPSFIATLCIPFLAFFELKRCTGLRPTGMSILLCVSIDAPLGGA